MKWIVNGSDGYATRLTAFRGGTLTLVNSSAVDVYYDVEAVGGTINSTAPGVVPIGTILKGGATPPSQVQFAAPAPDAIWVRAATQTVLDVHGDTSYADSDVYNPPAPANPPVLAGDNRGNLNVFKPKAKPMVNIGASVVGRFFQGLEKDNFRFRKG